MPRESFSIKQWDDAWRQVAQRQFADFSRAADKATATLVWNRGQVLDDARKILADAFADGDLELMAKLSPINPYQDIEP